MHGRTFESRVGAQPKSPMNDLDQLRRVAVIGVAAAIAVGVVSVLLGLAAVGWNFEALLFGDPETVLRGGRDGAVLWRWSMLLDIFYSYLLLVPLALYGYRRLGDRKPWLAAVALAGAFMYIALGAASAAILATAGSSLIEAHATAPAADQPAIELSFRVLRDALYFGVWQTLDSITAGTWVLSTGVLLLPDRRALGRLLVAVGLGFWLFACMTMVGVHSLAVLGAISAAVIAIWLAWLAFDRARPTFDAKQ